ncbi:MULTISPECIES: hypothetical protein [Streptomyces]|uniref:hypothetical protein n=1 Tax=Streptomyces TaxID=1883 RepID=UPI001929A900|nr:MULTISPECIES: hypothetical protein [unclassified Streptomyces]CAD5963848.1 conserved protein of unknown function [Streptomyces sp. KY70]CAD5978761.1 conserved protein of unknown function [Streptomyces sp. KY75]
MRFPCEARRDVHVRYTRPSCMGGFAWFTVDFEPLPDDRLGFEFVNPLGLADIDPECAQAVSEGILLWLTGAARDEIVFDRPPLPTPEELEAGVPVRSDAGPGFIALRAVLRHSRLHEVDSIPWAHVRAGWRAADKAMLGAEAADDPMDRAPQHHAR